MEAYAAELWATYHKEVYLRGLAVAVEYEQPVHRYELEEEQELMGLYDYPRNQILIVELLRMQLTPLFLRVLQNAEQLDRDSLHARPEQAVWVVVERV